MGKYQRKSEMRLAARQKNWESYGGKNANSGQLHRKPGSEKK